MKEVIKEFLKQCEDNSDDVVCDEIVKFQYQGREIPQKVWIGR